MFKRLYFILPTRTNCRILIGGSTGARFALCEDGSSCHGAEGVTVGAQQGAVTVTQKRDDCGFSAADEGKLQRFE